MLNFTIGSILLQKNKMIGLFSKKLLNSQKKKYTVMEKKVLSIIESLNI